MNIIVSLFSLALFFIIGVHDLRKKEIPDIYTAALWFMASLIGGPGAEIAVSVFALAFFSNSLVFLFNGKGYLSWGDILLVPVYAFFMYQLMIVVPWLYYIGILGVIVPLLLTGINRKPEPVGAWFVLAYMVSFVIFDIMSFLSLLSP